MSDPMCERQEESAADKCAAVRDADCQLADDYNAEVVRRLSAESRLRAVEVLIVAAQDFDEIGEGWVPVSSLIAALDSPAPQPPGHALSLRMETPVCECGVVLGGHKGTALDWHAQHLAEHVSPTAEEATR